MYVARARPYATIHAAATAGCGAVPASASTARLKKKGTRTTKIFAAVSISSAPATRAFATHAPSRGHR